MKKKLGSVNPCGFAYLYVDDKCIGKCLDAPVPIGYAMMVRKDITSASAFYPLFGEKTYTRKDMKEWIENAKVLMKFGKAPTNIEWA